MKAHEMEWIPQVACEEIRSAIGDSTRDVSGEVKERLSTKGLRLEPTRGKPCKQSQGLIRVYPLWAV